MNEKKSNEFIPEEYMIWDRFYPLGTELYKRKALTNEIKAIWVVREVYVDFRTGVLKFRLKQKSWRKRKRDRGLLIPFTQMRSKFVHLTEEPFDLENDLLMFKREIPNLNSGGILTA